MVTELFHIKSESPAAPELLFWSMAGHEGLSRASIYELTVLSKNHAITARDILGHLFDVVVEFQDADGAMHQRHCQGHATHFMRMTSIGRYFEYRITLRSWFWLLTKRINSRILQEKPVLSVFNDVLEDSPIKRLKKLKSDNVVGAHMPHGYCVQYQESDHKFLSRLLEEEGIYYWFDAHDAAGTMHLSDALDLAHDELPATGVLHFMPSSSAETRYNEIFQWVSMRQFDTGKFASLDNDFKVVSKKLCADKGDPDSHELADLEAFEFPGGYLDGDDTENIASLRLEELIGRRQRHWAFTHWPDVAVGKRFEFKGDPDGLRDGGYVIAGCTFVASHPGHEGIEVGDTERSLTDMLRGALEDDAVNADSHAAFGELIAQSSLLRGGRRGHCTFLLTLLPTTIPWRPPRLTPRARMPGPQSAIVVGKAGEEIWTDTYGRVKVQFHWDRYGRRDENSSCWIRVSQPWAGKGWGSVSIPRIGQEVIVDFLEGDPDQPIIVGRIYNGENMPPYSLPGEAVVSGLKTNTHKGRGFNEMSMNDTAGKEQITIHAQYDLNTTVKHDEKHIVETGNRTIEVQTGTHTETIKGNTAIKITTGTYDHNVATGTAHFHVKGAVTEDYDASQTTTVKGAIYIHSLDSIQLHTGLSKLWMAKDGNISLTGVNITITGSNSVSVNGKTITVTGDAEIKESAPNVAISGGTQAQFGVGNQQLTCDKAKVNVSGAAINASAVGMHEITGAVVKIN